MSEVIQAAGLVKRYGKVVALDGLDLTVPEGGVFGFLGPNGAGKTTTIRALVGHLRATGSISVLGAEVPGGLAGVIDRVGALVEQPSFFPGFSGRTNLELLARSRGFPSTRVDAALEAVALTERAGTRFSGYSLGMKQRLGVAAVLLKEPELLILDEPSNGLDPAGIRDVRELIRRLGRDGHTTVLLSSHLLAEIQQVADSVTILTRGRRVAHGPVSEVLAGRATHDVVIRVPDRDAAGSVLHGAGFALSPFDDVRGPALAVHNVVAPAEVTRLLAQHGHYLEELTPVHADLETAFLAITGEPA
jgi:ABC-2 type transport system ATP-binding protein